MRSFHVNRGFARLGLVISSVILIVAAGYAGFATWELAGSFFPERSRVLIPSGHMIEVPYGLTEPEYVKILSPHFSETPPEVPGNTPTNMFADELQKVGAIRLDSAVHDALRPLEHAHEVRRRAKSELIEASVIALAAVAVFIALRIFGWIVAGFFND